MNDSDYRASLSDDQRARFDLEAKARSYSYAFWFLLAFDDSPDLPDLLNLLAAQPSPLRWAFFVLLPLPFDRTFWLCPTAKATSKLVTCAI